MSDRIVCGRVGDHGRQQRRFSRVQFGRAGLLLDAAANVICVAAEVNAGRRFDSVSPVTEVDRVEVLTENLLLRPLPREVVGQRRFAQLLRHGSLILSSERVLYELLRDR